MFSSRSSFGGLANLLTLLRLACAPLVFIAVGLVDLPWVGLSIYVVGLLTDAADGRLARATGSNNAFGRAMDSAADKCLVAGAMCGLATARGFPLALVFLFVFREFSVFGLRTIRLPGGLTIAAIKDSLGRLRFLVLHAGLLVLLMPGVPRGLHVVAVAVVAVAVMIAYLTLAYYLVRDRADLCGTMRR